MKQIKLLKGFESELAGSPDLSIIPILEPLTRRVSAMDIPYIRPGLLVKKMIS